MVDSTSKYNFYTPNFLKLLNLTLSIISPNFTYRTIKPIKTEFILIRCASLPQTANQ